jgi:fido (protein-threonine AMPylation protein)
MFLISEAHPFNDGNARIARIMMNAELVAGGHSRPAPHWNRARRTCLTRNRTHGPHGQGR